MAENVPNVELLLQSLLSTDNDVRSEAEKAYESVPVPGKLALLLHALSQTELPPEGRTMSAVLIRRVFTSDFDEFWPQVAPEIQNGVKTQLLLAVQKEDNLSVCRKICDAVAELIRNLTDEDGVNQWPEAMKLMFEWAASPHINIRLAALHIFRCVPGIFGSQQAQYLEVIKQMMVHNLKDTENPQVRFDAIRATCAFLLENDTEVQVLNFFRDALPFIIEGVAESITGQNDDALLKCLVEMAENIPKYLRGQLDVIITMCLKVISNCNLGDEWRQMAVEVIVTLSETASAMLRRHSKFMPMLVPQLLAMMVDLEEDEEWAFRDEDVDEEEETDSNAMAAESALDRLACGIGGKTMLPHIITNVPQMLQKEDWRYRHAALMAISACGEGCHAQMEAMLANIVDTIIPFMKDSHPRVRYAACNAVGQMCTDFAPNMQKKYHQKVCPCLLEVMNDDTYPRVQAHAAAALVNFSEDCPKSILTGYLDPIIQRLEEVLARKFKELQEKGTKMVLEQMVTTLASVADTSEDKFTKYYDKFMPQLKYILLNATAPEVKVLRGKTIECISLIGLAVGKEKFMQDCNDVMNLLLKTQTDQPDLPDDDPQVSYMMSAWARMCKILGKDFQQFLPVVMGPVLKAASLKPEVTLIDSDDIKGMENDTDWQFVTLGDQQSFGIRTAGLEEKSTACQMLVCYARELKEAFAAYAEDVVKIMVPLLKFYFHDDVRSSATESLPYLLECAEIRGQQYVNEMWTYICPELLKAIDMEPEKSVLPEHLHTVAKCIERLGVGCLNDEHMKDLLKHIDKVLKDHFERQDERQEQRTDEDYDEVVEENLLNEDDEDVYILSKVADIMHSLFGTHKENFLPLFETLAPHFLKLLHSLKYKQYFLSRLLESVLDKQAEVRQAAAYGVGVMGKCGGEPYAQHCAEVMPLLLQVIADPESRSVENAPATENAISAITKICKHNSSLINVDEILPHWLSWLPVWEDEEEAVWIYGYLCDLVQMNHPLILGELNVNLPRILTIIAEAMIRETVIENVELTQRLLGIVKQVQSQDAMFKACMAQLSTEHQTALSDALSQHRPS